MTQYETIAIPFNNTPDGQQYLTEHQLMEIPELRDFIERFPHCFEHDPMMDVWWFFPDGKKDNPGHRP
jgi:hypothetical protein